MEDQEKKALANHFANLSEAYYFDMTRCGTQTQIFNLCEDVIASKDYDKFSQELAKCLYEDVYIKEERLKPDLIKCLIHVTVESAVLRCGMPTFSPAARMFGDNEPNMGEIKGRVVSYFNRCIDEGDIYELKQYYIKM